MSKPEPPQKIDPLPASRTAEHRKTGWEPPSPQKVRINERRMGILLAFSLLAAIGFVAYRKFDEHRQQPGSPEKLFTETKPNEEPSNNPPPDADALKLTGAEPSATLGADDARSIAFDPPTAVAADDASPTFERTSAPTAMPIADTRPPEQTEPAGGAIEMQLGSSDASQPQPEEPEPAAEFGGDPFEIAAAATESSDPPQQPDVALDTSDPFGGPALAASEPAGTAADEQTTFSSDAGSPFGSPASLGKPEFDAEITATEPSLAAPVSSNGDEPVADTPTLDLFGGDDPIPEQNDQLPPTPEPAASPWGEPVEVAATAESQPPGMLEVNDPQVMPTLTVSPFAAADSVPEPEPHPAESPLTNASDPFPQASAVTEVRESSRRQSHDDQGNPFAGRESVSVRQRTPRSQQRDPFAPAHDVSPAVSEDEVVIHVVQSGDNFWKIARDHYGAGRYSTALAAYNQSRIPDPRHMRPGMKVLVPSETTLIQQFPQLVSGQSSTPYVMRSQAPPGFSVDASGRPQYRVARGDTLSEIAQRHLGRSSRWRQIYGMNKDQLADAHSLTTGMVLRLPADATQVRMHDERFRGR